jgi:hypothetical protein
MRQAQPEQLATYQSQTRQQQHIAAAAACTQSREASLLQESCWFLTPACDNSIRQGQLLSQTPPVLPAQWLLQFCMGACGCAAPQVELKGNIGTKHCCGWHCSICTNKEQTAGTSKSCILRRCQQCWRHAGTPSEQLLTQYTPSGVYMNFGVTGRGGHWLATHTAIRRTRLLGPRGKSLTSQNAQRLHPRRGPVPGPKEHEG